LPARSQQILEIPLTCGLEPEEGFEPSTFRIRDGRSALM
jgi:hypothetical protein